MADLKKVIVDHVKQSELIGTDFPVKNRISQGILPAPRRGPRAASSEWEEQAAGGRRGDGPEHRTTSAGRLANSGPRENIESANKHKTRRDAVCRTLRSTRKKQYNNITL